jgi:hypothetical protein
MSLYGGKGNYQPMLGKKGDYSARLLGGVKGFARIAEDPITQFGLGVIAPEVYGGLALAKETGLLKKVAGM